MPTKTATTRPTHRRAIPLDTEPLTPEDFKAIREADEAFARGDYCIVDDVQADIDADVARLRSHKDPSQ
jgi:hypothetical protein